MPVTIEQVLKDLGSGLMRPYTASTPSLMESSKQVKHGDALAPVECTSRLWLNCYATPTRIVLIFDASAIWQVLSCTR